MSSGDQQYVVAIPMRRVVTGHIVFRVAAEGADAAIQRATAFLQDHDGGSLVHNYEFEEEWDESEVDASKPTRVQACDMSVATYPEHDCGTIVDMDIDEMEASDAT